MPLEINHMKMFHLYALMYLIIFCCFRNFFQWMFIYYYYFLIKSFAILILLYLLIFFFCVIDKVFYIKLFYFQRFVFSHVQPRVASKFIDQKVLCTRILSMNVEWNRSFNVLYAWNHLSSLQVINFICYLSINKLFNKK